MQTQSSHENAARLKIALLLVLALFLLPAAYTTYQALWFKFSAAQAEKVRWSSWTWSAPKVTSSLH